MGIDRLQPALVKPERAVRLEEDRRRIFGGRTLEKDVEGRQTPLVEQEHRQHQLSLALIGVTCRTRLRQLVGIGIAFASREPGLHHR